MALQLPAMKTCPICRIEIDHGESECSSCGNDPSTSEIHPGERSRSLRIPPGTKVDGRYRILRLVGSGGFGDVYQADDLTLKQPVALKVLHACHAEHASNVESFLDEVRAARLVTHPNVCRVYDLGWHNKRPFLSMQYIEGPTLAELLKKNGSLNDDKVLAIAAQVCAGLQALHDRHLIHKDIKPANVLLDANHVAYLADLGLAAQVEESVIGSFAGTLPYMAPEVLNLSNPTKQSDLYSLGVLLYKAATGDYPFNVPESGDRRQQLAELVNRIGRGIETPYIRLKNLDKDAVDLIIRCLEANPKRRPSTAQEVAETLESIIKKRKLRRPRRRNPFIDGRAVTGSNFFGRKDQMESVLSRLETGQAVFIVGGLGTGKSSFLLEVANQLRRENDNVAVKWIDLETVAESYCPAAFWEDSLEPLAQDSPDSRTAELMAKTAANNYSSGSLQQLLQHLGEIDRKLIVLFDEFDYLLDNNNFPDEFFALLRSLSTTTGGFTIAPASRFSMSELDAQRSLRRRGSGYFSHAVEFQLRPLENDAISTLLDRAEGEFSAEDRLFIRCMAGRHPALLQAMAQTLFATRGKYRWRRSARAFFNQRAGFIDRMWQTWSSQHRTAGLVLGLTEWVERSKPGSTVAVFEKAHLFDQALTGLARNGLVESGEKVGDTHMLSRFPSRGAEWVLGAEIFAWWVWEVAIANGRSVAAYDDWISGSEYNCLLSSEEWARLHDSVREGQGREKHGAGHLADELLNGILKWTSRCRGQ